MKLTKKQIKAVVSYLKSIEQHTTAKQFKKDWSKSKYIKSKKYTIKEIDSLFRGPDIIQLEDIHKHIYGDWSKSNPTVNHENNTLEFKQKLKELTKPTYHEEDQPGKENTISKNDEYMESKGIFRD